MQVKEASVQDLRKILELQYFAYQSEAELLKDSEIPPLKQTLAELQEEYKHSIFLIMEEHEDLVGAVRAHCENGTVYIGKLMVHPQWQGQGFGTKLLAEIESLFPGQRYELFTSSLSEKNLQMYMRHGYTVFQEKVSQAGWSLRYLEKV